MIPLYISVAVGLVCFILYALDRRSKQEPIDWSTASKLSTFGSLISGGIAFALTSGEAVAEVVKNIQPEVAPIQEMFVGVPTF
jgi:hypothetical protein